MRKLKNLLLLTVILTFALTSTISCGGGGGGGGGAAGPAASSDAPTENEPTESAPARSAAAEIISFKFEKAENTPALDALSNDLEGSSSDGQNIIVSYNYGTLDAQPLLKPTIVVSPNATILEDTNQQFNFFDSANPVRFTVKAEDGTEKVWTVAMQENAPGVHNIYYRPEGITHPYPATYDESVGIQFNEPANKVIAKNYYFDGWREDESATTTIDGWGRMEKTGDVTLYAKLQPAPYADLENSKIFANGIPVTVKEDAGATMIYFTDASGNEKSLKSVNENYNTNFAGFAGFDLYAGTSGEADAPTITTPGYTAYMSAPTGNITIEGGRLNNVSGGNGDNPEAALAYGSNINLSGHPEIGNQKKSGIWLKSFSGNKVNVNTIVDSTNDNKITLIAAPDMPTGAVVVEATGHYTLKEHYTLRNSYRTENVELENGGNNVVLKASISLPDPEDVKWSKDSDGDYFTLGSGHFHSNGTILSIGVEGGFFKVPSATVTGGNFDMAIRYSDDSLNEYLDNRYIDGEAGSGLKTSDKLKYVQFKSASGDIAASAASSFLEKVKFFIEPGKSSVKIKLNLQTIPLTEIKGVTYFNGSFYKIVQQNGISWDNALAKAKESKFNNLEGYLMTITSQTENMFIYDRVYAKADPKINQSNARGWIGAKRENGIWKWVCGPEAGTEFYDQTKREPMHGNFSSWDSWEDRTRNRIWTTYPASAFEGGVIPKYDKENNAIQPIAQSHRNDDVYWPEFIKGVQEKDNKWYVDWKHPHADKGDCAYYTGTYVWGNENGSKGYIIEYTAYEAEGANNPDAPVLIAEKDYSRP